MNTPVYHDDVERCVDDVIAAVGKRIVFGIPLGLGKPNHVVNALYRKAQRDPSIHLTILTALSPERPTGTSELEKRFLAPLVDRLFGDYPDLAYVVDVRNGRLPSNIELSEFYFKPGAFVASPTQQQNYMQQNYISCNYTDAARAFVAHGVNVFGQIVSKRVVDGEEAYSLSCNTDVTLDVLPLIEQERKKGKKIVVVGQVNDNLPFMGRDAVVRASAFDFIVDHPRYHFTLFGATNTAVNVTDYAIGLTVSTLIRDGGTLQIGIGSLGDAIVYACQLRHGHNEVYRSAVADCGISDRWSSTIERVGGTAPFDAGLYGSSEMLVNGFLHLYRDGILKRRVYDSVPLQRLLNERLITERVTARTLELLLERKAIGAKLSRDDFEVLVAFGIFKPELRYEDGQIRLAGGERIAADLDRNFAPVVEHCLGTHLANGIVMHAGFFLGPPSLYEALRQLTEKQNREFCMTGVSRVNQLYGDEGLRALQRRDARFINTTIVMTLLGAAASDGLDDGRVVSGVGGQYNFIAMAHALPGARSILMLRSTRRKGGALSSNIAWQYGHVTIPRHLRDIVVTEYGMADLRDRSDKEVIAELLNIADSRFQHELMEAAKRAGKLPDGYEIPSQFRNNTPERLATVLSAYKQKGWFPDFPLGTDLSREEITLGKVLKGLKANMATPAGLLKQLFTLPLERRPVPPDALPYLARLRLDQPEGWKEQLLQNLVVGALVSGGHVTPEGEERSGEPQSTRPS